MVDINLYFLELKIKTVLLKILFRVYMNKTYMTKPEPKASKEYLGQYSTCGVIALSHFAISPSVVSLTSIHICFLLPAYCLRLHYLHCGNFVITCSVVKTVVRPKNYR